MQQKEQIEKVKDYINRNLEQKLDLDQIAKIAGYSKFHLNRLFTKETGVTIYQYLQSRRLNLAAQKLAKTKLPISQIALEAGYDSQQAFTLAFKQNYLCTPRQYRSFYGTSKKMLGGCAA